MKFIIGKENENATNLKSTEKETKKVPNELCCYVLVLLVVVCVQKVKKIKKKPKPTNGCFEIKALSEMNVECGK